MKLHHYYRSSASYRVRIALALKGIAWKPHAVHLGKGEHFAPAHTALSPARAVPVLEDAGVTVAQSLAIIEYLDETCDGPALLPETAAGRAFVRELALDIGCEIHPLNNTRVLRYLEQAGLDERARNAWYRHWVGFGLGVVEAKLERAKRSAFCHGDRPTLADCFLVPQIFNARRFECDVTPFPQVMRVFEACMALEAFSSTQPARYEPAGGAI